MKGDTHFMRATARTSLSSVILVDSSVILTSSVSALLSSREDSASCSAAVS